MPEPLPSSCFTDHARALGRPQLFFTAHGMGPSESRTCLVRFLRPPDFRRRPAWVTGRGTGARYTWAWRYVGVLGQTLHHHPAPWHSATSLP